MLLCVALLPCCAWQHNRQLHASAHPVLSIRSLRPAQHSATNSSLQSTLQLASACLGQHLLSMIRSLLHALHPASARFGLTSIRIQHALHPASASYSQPSICIRLLPQCYAACGPVAALRVAAHPATARLGASHTQASASFSLPSTRQTTAHFSLHPGLMQLTSAFFSLHLTHELLASACPALGFFLLQHTCPASACFGKWNQLLLALYPIP